MTDYPTPKAVVSKIVNHHRVDVANPNLTNEFTGQPDVRDLTDIMNVDGKMIAGSTSLDIIREHARSMFPSEIQSYQDWATHHPQMDPRTWAPLAMAGIHPLSPDGMAISGADAVGQVKAGTYGQVAGAPATTTGPVQIEPPAPGQSPFVGIGDAIGAAPDAAYNAVKGGVRTALTGLEFPYQLGAATERTLLGQNAKEQDAAKGLTGAEKAWADNLVMEAKNNRPVDYGQPTTDQHVLFGQRPHTVDAAKEAQVRAYVASQTTGKAPAPGISDVLAQTDLGQVIKDPSLLTQTVPTDAIKVGDNYYDKKDIVPGVDSNGQPTAMGSLRQGAKPISIQETSWLPNKVAMERNREAAIKAYDITTADERARGVSPTAWTLGRGIASVWMRPDDVNFGVVSGIFDAGNSLLLDPVNLIPADPIVKGVRGVSQLAVKGAREVPVIGEHVPVLLSEGFKVDGAKTVVAFPTQRFGQIGSDFHGAREGARGRAVVDTLTNLGQPKRIADAVEGGLARNAQGIIPGPHGLVVMNDLAYRALNTGKGARIVSAIAKETNPVKIWLASGKKLDYSLAEQLAETTTESGIKAIIGTRMGYDIKDATALRPFGHPPVLFKNPLISGWNTAGTLLDSGGFVSKAGRQAIRDNYSQFGMGGAVRGLYRRPFRTTPDSGGSFNWEDKDVVVDQLTRFLGGARVPLNDYADKVAEVMRQNTGVARYEAMYAKNGLLDSVLKDRLMRVHGLTEGETASVTKAFAGGLDPSQRNWLNANLGAGAWGAATAAGDVGKPILLGEQLARTSGRLPDYRTLARVTGSVGTIKRAVGMRNPGSATSDFFNGLTTFWRDTTLIRGAFALRNVGEMSVASGLAGYSSMLASPAHFLAAAHSYMVAAEMHTLAGRFTKALATGIAEPSHLENLNTGARFGKTRALALQGAALPAHLVGDVWNYLAAHEGLSYLHPRMNQHAVNIKGTDFWEPINRAMRTGSDADMEKMFDGMASVHGNFTVDERGARSAKMNGTDTFLRDDLRPSAQRGYIGALVEKLRVMATDKDFKNLADPAVSPQEAVADFTAHRAGLMGQMRPDVITADPLTHDKHLTGLQDILNRVTLGRPDLLEAVRTGMFAGARVGPDNKALHAYFADMLTSPVLREQMPEKGVGLTQDFNITHRLRQFANDFFANSGNFDDIFGRSAVVRQAYVRRVLELAPAMTRAAKSDAVARLRDAGDIKLARQVQRTGVNAKGAGTLGIDEVHTIASGFALKETQRVFYDAFRRQNYAMALRVIAPFTQATFNTFRRWGELSLRSPNLMYRSVKPLAALNQPDSGVIYNVIGRMTGDETMQSYYTPGHPELSVNGFFFTDAYGDRKFAYPGIGPLSQLIGAPQGVGFLGQASGLNVAGNSVNPGFGPMLTLGASFFTGTAAFQGDNPQGQAMRWLFPYGAPSGSFVEKLAGAFEPTMFRKLAATEDPTSSATATMKMMSILAASGDYDLTKGPEQRRMAEDAKQLAVRMQMFTGLMGSVTPSTFSVTPQVAAQGDKTGDVRRLMMQGALMAEFRQYIAKDYNQGVAAFVKDYGPYALYGVLPQTQTDGPTATNDIWNFRTAHPDTYNRNKEVLGLFFNGDPTAAFSLELYTWQKDSGERSAKTPEEFIKSVNNALGWMLYDSKVAEIAKTMPMNQQGLARQLAQDDIQNKYPGWTGKAGDLGKFDDRIKKVRDALGDPAIKSLPSADLIDTYLNSRDAAIKDAIHQFGNESLTTKQTAGIRDQLFTIATNLMKQDRTGGFATAWDQLFSGEFTQIKGSANG